VRACVRVCVCVCVCMCRVVCERVRVRVRVHVLVSMQCHVATARTGAALAGQVHLPQTLNLPRPLHLP